jgi:hypothetical protein
MRISDLRFTPAMDNPWRGHRVEMPKTDAQRLVSNPEAAARFIKEFGDVEIQFVECYKYWEVPAFAEGREAYSKLKQAHCDQFGSN